MNTTCLSVCLAMAILPIGCASRPAAATLVIATPTVVEAACGECKLGLKGDDCDLAIRWKGKSYFVDGVKTESLGEAHAADGICETIRKARVTGEVKGDRFVATSFVLLPVGTP